MFLMSGKSSDAAQAGVDMVQRVTTVAFEGIEVRPVDVQVQVAHPACRLSPSWIVNANKPSQFTFGLRVVQVRFWPLWSSNTPTP